MSTKTLPTYISESDAAIYLGVSVKSLRRWRFERRGPAYAKIEGKLVRYPSKSLEDWAKSQIVVHEKNC